MAILTTGRTFKTSHWYTPDGKPAHQQAARDGRGQRPTRIADAVRLGLLPSVTSILSIFDKPGLNNWKVSQAVLAAGNTPRQQDESIEYWSQRVMDTAFKQVEDAADLGSQIHAALEAAMAGDPYDDALRVHVAPVLAWKDKTGIEIVEREKVLVNAAEGYAGCADVLFRWGQRGIGVLDYKTRKTRPGEQVTPYDGQGMQLAAYAAAHYGEQELPRVLAANIFISTTEPGRMEVCKHEDIPALYEAFKHACALWRHIKGYDPRKSLNMEVGRG